VSIKKKITDFVRLEQGSIGGKAAMVTGAAMVAVVLAAAVGAGKVRAKGPCGYHVNIYTHASYTDYTYPNISPHRNYKYHTNIDYPPC
jgi:hypothetical protein